jgi:hypothetical protein
MLDDTISKKFWLYSEHKKSIQSLSKSKRLHLITSWIVDEIEKRCFWHLMLRMQGFLVVQY